MTMAVIAIDGPAGAGKSTVARKVAERVGLPYLDTGAMYRCVALAVSQGSIDTQDSARVGHLASSSIIAIEGDRALLDGCDVSDLIRTPAISAIVSIIAAQPDVREAMREQQRRWVSEHGGGVVEGRDIGTVVIPDADLKIFLTASPDERAQRRVSQAGGEVEQIARNIAERDRIDSTRVDSPLRPAADSVMIDSTGCSIEEVVDKIVDYYARKTGGAEHGRS